MPGEEDARPRARRRRSPAPRRPGEDASRAGARRRPEVAALLASLKVARKKLGSLLSKYSGEAAYFDPVYRYYHQSFKVFGLQSATLELVAALHALAPDRTLNPRFMRIVSEGTGKTFELEHNHRWDEVTRPIVEAFLHARFFLEAAVRSAKMVDAPPQLLPSDWAALLCLFELR